MEETGSGCRASERLLQQSTLGIETRTATETGKMDNGKRSRFMIDLGARDGARIK